MTDIDVLLVHNYYKNSGGEDQVFSSEKRLLQSHDHNVFCYTDHNSKIQGVDKLCAPFRMSWSTDSYANVDGLIEKLLPDVVHFHNTFIRISPAAYYAVKKHGVPVIQTLHNYRLLCPAAKLHREGLVCEKCLKKTVPWLGVFHGCWRNSQLETFFVALMLSFHKTLKTYLEQVDVYIVLTEFARKKFIQGGIPEEKIIIKPNFLQQDPGVSYTSNDYALFVGRISYEKGLTTMLKAWQWLPNIKLKIVGDGPSLGKVCQIKAQKNLTNVEVLGRLKHDKVLSLMKKASCLIFPSQWYEGFPMTILEAFACGLPVIASRMGAMEEIVDELRTGLLFSPNDPEVLATQVEWAWRNPEVLAQMGKNARREYEKKYTAEQNYEILMAIYSQAISKSKT